MIFIELKDWVTLKEAAEIAEIKPDTLRSYINRNEVIPEVKRIKIGRQWFINREWLEEKYGK